MQRGSRLKVSKVDGRLWLDLRPWILGALGFLVLLIGMEFLVPGSTKWLPLLASAAYAVYFVVKVLSEWRKPKSRRDWSTVWVPLW